MRTIDRVVVLGGLKGGWSPCFFRKLAIFTFAIVFRSILCKSNPCYFDSTIPLTIGMLVLM